jgi:DNA-binding response OmpR family regulator
MNTPAPAPSPEVTVSAEAVTVLLAEGYAVLRSVLRRVLEAAGFAVLEAGDAAAAQEVAAAHQGRIRLLVCDLSLPPRGGPDLAARLRQQRPGLRVLLIGNEGGSDPEGLPLLEKPFNPAQLLARVREFLD